MLEPIGQHGTVFYWTVVEMYTFDDGTLWGKVLFTGGEKDCEAFVESRMQSGFGLYEIAYPRGLGEKVIRSIEYNIIATSKPGIVYKQSPMGITRLQ